MKTKTGYRRIGALAPAIAFALAACMGGTGEGNPECGYVSVSVRAKAGQPVAMVAAGAAATALAKSAATDTLRLLDDGKTPYAINHIFAHIDQIEIPMASGSVCYPADTVRCTDSSMIVTGSRYVDLLEKPSPGIAKDLRMPLGTYSRLKIRFSKLVDRGDGSVPSAYHSLVGHSIMMKGAFPYDGVPDRDLTLFLDFDEPFAFGNDTGIAIRTVSPYSWAGTFLASRWLQKIEINDCLKDHKIALQPDGSLVIDGATDCKDLEDSMLVNVRESTVLEMNDD